MTFTQVHLFENDKSEFILPEGLYLERLKALETALRERDTAGGLNVNVYYESNSRSEDAAMESFPMETVAFVPEDSPANPHLTGSGFNVVQVRTTSTDYDEAVSPWDISLDNVSIPRPCLSDEDKEMLLDNLNTLSRDSGIAELFNVDVDTDRYWDYERMVEIGMSLMFIKRRLKEDYYASKVSVVGDMRLIKINCIKYNGLGSEIAPMAIKLCDDFENKVLSDDEKSFLISEEEYNRLSTSAQSSSESQQPLSIRLRLRQRTNQVTVERQPQGDRARRRSSLESLPPPEEPPARRRSARQASQPSMQRRSSFGGASGGDTSGRRRSLRTRSAGPSVPDNPRQGRMQRSGGQLDSLARTGLRAPPLQRSRSGRQLRASNADIGEEGAPDRSGARSISRPTRGAEVRNRPMYREDSEDDDDESEEEVIAQPTSRAQRASRASRRQAAEAQDESEAEPESEEDLEDTDEESNESDESPRPRRGLKRNASASTRTSPRARRRTANASSPESPTRRSSRRGTENHKSYEEVNSDYEDEEEEPSEESEEEEEEEPTTRARGRRVSSSYAELPSDFDEEEESDEEDLPKRAPKKRKGTCMRSCKQ